MADQSTLYSRWLNGRLTDKEHLELKAKGEDIQLENIIKALDLWESEKLDLNSAFAQQLKKKKNPAKVKKLLTRRSWLAAAASVAVLISCAYFIYTNSFTSYHASNGTNEYITLSDGSSVRLNDGSSLKQRKGLFANVREVHLEGEGLFEVTKGEKFKVLSPQGIVEVLGTQFNVKTWGEKLLVECYEGQVKASNKVESFILSAGESVMLTDGITSAKETIINNQPDWLNGFSLYEDEPVSEVFEELERQYDINVVQPKSGKKFTGQFTHDDLNAALESICLPLGFQFNIDQQKKSVTVTLR